MSLEETEQKIRQFCHLWQLYADISVELKKKSELSQTGQSQHAECTFPTCLI